MATIGDRSEPYWPDPIGPSTNTAEPGALDPRPYVIPHYYAQEGDSVDKILHAVRGQLAAGHGITIIVHRGEGREATIIRVGYTGPGRDRPLAFNTYSASTPRFCRVCGHATLRRVQGLRYTFRTAATGWAAECAACSEQYPMMPILDEEVLEFQE